MPKVVEFERHPIGDRMNNLNRLSVQIVKRGSQDLVATENLDKAPLKYRHIERPLSVNCYRVVVDWDVARHF